MNTSNSKAFKSGLYKGWVGHRRLSPKLHAFRYEIFMCYLDLDELDEVLATNLLWSKSPFALARFKRSDYFGDASVDLKTAVTEKIKRELNIEIKGSVRLLTNLRYFGYLVNPLSIYYCFDEKEQLQALLLEVTNTPWGERHQYALPCNPNLSELRTSFSKEMHVSPFLDMNLNYEWLSTAPAETIDVFMKNIEIETNNGVENRSHIFEASMILQRTAITNSAMFRVLLNYPFMTFKVIFSIYWQAIKLFVKRVPIYSHPDKSTSL